MQRIIFRAMAIVVLSLTASACQITPIQHAGVADPDKRCGQIMKRVMIDPPPPVGLLGSGSDKAALVLEANDPLVQDIERLYADAAKSAGNRKHPLTGDNEPVSNSMLFLSGGSQNGAFGAGYLSAWSATRQNGLPRFRLVTGISTGALQSTFAFLDRARQTELEYQISNEGRLLHPFTTGGIKSKSKIEQARGAISLMRKGAIAELEPLRARLHELIDKDLLYAVADEAGDEGDPDRRKLLVGAVEMDSGDAYVFDLTEAARLYKAGNEAMRECYIEALMASSSVPMAALPVFVDGKMYIDGGARFGVISDFKGAIFRRIAKRLPSEDPKNLFILINGTLEVSQTCHLKDCAEDPVTPTPPGQVPQHSKWSFDNLALRSLSILINQSYRSSVFWARTNSEELGFTPRFVRIENAHLKHPATLDFDVPSGETMSCSQWRDRDVKRDAPVEFHPRFMRCLIDYGKKREEVLQWVKAE